MGVTITSPNHSIDLGYFGFYRLRRKIAYLVSSSVGRHYEELVHVPIFHSEEEEEQWWKDYDEITNSLLDAQDKNIHKVFGFLYASDCDGQVSYETCKQLLTVIGDYDDQIVYGYAGRPDGAKFQDFKRLLEDCAENKKPLKWW